MHIAAGRGANGRKAHSRPGLACAVTAIALLVPESEAGTSHLQILSKVATALTDEGFRSAVKSTDDPAAIAGLINERLA